MSRLKILNNNEIKDFDSPPVFSGEDRKRIFYLPQWASEFVDTFRRQRRHLQHELAGIVDDLRALRNQ